MAQYINEAGEAMVDDIVNLLKSIEPLSQAQDSMAKAVIQSLLAATKSNTVLQADIEKKKNVFLTMVDIATQKGKFEFLTNLYKEYREKELRIKNDTIDKKIYALQKKYLAYEDSLKELDNELLDIMQSPLETRASKELASTVLGRTNNLAIADFLFQNYTFFMFSDIDVGFDNDTNCWGCERNGAADFVYDKVYDPDIYYTDEYGHSKVKISGITNWMAFPFFIKYWGNKEYNEKLENTLCCQKAEFAIFHNMISENYKKPWLLYEFMAANVENPDTKIMKEIGESMKDKKNQFEKQEKNKK